MMYGHEKSDPAIVAMKPANKAEGPFAARPAEEKHAAEPVERRAGTKGNADQQSTSRTQSRASVSQALERIRQRLAVTHPRWEPDAGKPHVRICAGGAQQWASLPLQRREFITLVGGAAAWPLAAPAQKFRPVIGYLHATSAQANRHQVLAFEKGLAEAGYVTGQNITIEYRWAEGQYDRLPGLAAELVQRQVAVIVTGTPVAALAAKKATSSIPIVFVVGSDPVKNGLVVSLSRPGGNMTGATFFSNLLTAKRFALLHEFVPNAKSFAALVNPKNANAQMQMDDAQTTAREMGVQLLMANAASVPDIDNVFERFKTEKVDALLVLSDSFLNTHAGQIAAYALRRGIPTCFAYREPAAAGGLMSYGVSVTGAAVQAGNYTGRILKGENPGDLPVQQPTKFDFVLNMKTAKALGLAVPDKLIALADEIIE